MTTGQLKDRLGLESCVDTDCGNMVTGCYVGDLLSWVMGRAPEGCAWITVMQNANVAAVALLAGVACVILAEGVKPDDPLSKRAKEKNIPVYSSPLTAYELAWKIKALLEK